MDKSDLVVVCGAGGFIGGHLVGRLRTLGYTTIRAIDCKPLSEWHQIFGDVDNQIKDLRLLSDCYLALQNSSYVFNLACDMGGMGFLSNNKAACMLSVLINTHLLMAARDLGVHRFFFASSAGVYNVTRQECYDVIPLRESDVYPAMPEDGYGWEKLFSERMCRHFREDFGVNTRVARYHNIYGPYGDFDGGREKAPAAICRKVAYAKLNGLAEIEVWGDGTQTRTFTYIDDCIEGTIRLMTSDISEPMNIGSEELVSINQLVDMVAKCAGIEIKKSYITNAPRGVFGRNSDNSMIQSMLGWSPKIPLEEGLLKVYSFVEQQILSSGTAFMGSSPSRLTLLVDSPKSPYSR